jgi:hypothetical protein
MWVGSYHTLAALPPGKFRCPLYRRLGGPQGRSGWVRQILPPLGFDPQTIRLVASRYTETSYKYFIEDGHSWNWQIPGVVAVHKPLVLMCFAEHMSCALQSNTD